MLKQIFYVLVLLFVSANTYAQSIKIYADKTFTIEKLNGIYEYHYNGELLGRNDFKSVSAKRIGRAIGDTDNLNPPFILIKATSRNNPNESVYSLVRFKNNIAIFSPKFSLYNEITTADFWNNILKFEGLDATGMKVTYVVNGNNLYKDHKQVTSPLSFLESDEQIIKNKQLEVSNLVKDFSSTVACNINEDSFKVVKVINTGKEFENNLGDKYLVYWEGDLGCSGGNGTVNPVFSIVEVSSFNRLVVVPNIEQPELNLVCADTLTGKNALINIQGITYGENDHQHSPSKKIQYAVKFNDLKNSFEDIYKNENPNTEISNECVQRVR